MRIAMRPPVYLYQFTFIFSAQLAYDRIFEAQSCVTTDRGMIIIAKSRANDISLIENSRPTMTETLGKIARAMPTCLKHSPDIRPEMETFGEKTEGCARSAPFRPFSLRLGPSTLLRSSGEQVVFIVKT